MSWRRSLVGEICWDLGGIPVVPLTLEGAPCAALPYAHRAAGLAIRAAGRAAFVAGSSVLTGIVDVADDLTGDVFTDDLLTQELLKYPPSRALADSLLLRRENWWWIPRMLVRLTRTESETSLPPRVPGDPLIVRPGPQVGIAPDEWAGVAPGPAVVFGHRYTVPDMERWEIWRREGTVTGGEFRVSASTPEPPADLTPLGLGERLRRHRRLERACRRGIAEAEKP